MVKEKDLKRQASEMWCSSAGKVCGYYNIRKQFMSALSSYMINHNLNKEDVIGISGIGCSGRFTTWQDVVTVHATHGNAANLAQGAAMMRDVNKKKGLIYVVSGDGDALAIGRANFENLCRSNSDVTYMILNNNIYAMTGGQTAPTTQTGQKTISAFYGNLEKAIDPVAVALGAGATFVARTSSYPHDSKSLQDILYAALEHKGTSVIEIISPCQTKNLAHKKKKLSDLEKEYLDRAISMEDASCLFFDTLFKGISPVAKYMTLRDHTSNRCQKDMLINGIIHQSSENTYGELLAQQKPDVQKQYGDGSLSNMLGKLLKKSKVDMI